MRAVLASVLALCLVVGANAAPTEPCGQADRAISLFIDTSDNVTDEQVELQKAFALSLYESTTTSVTGTVTWYIGAFDSTVWKTCSSSFSSCVGAIARRSGTEKSIDTLLQFIANRVSPDKKRDVEHSYLGHILILTDAAGGIAESSLEYAKEIRTPSFVTRSPGQYQNYIHTLMVPPMPSTTASGLAAARLARVVSPPVDKHMHIFRSFEDLSNSVSLFTSMLLPHPGSVCSVWGHTNVRTFDGLSFTYGGVGDFYLWGVEDTMTVSVRLAKNSTSGTTHSIVTAVAVNVTGVQLVEVYSSSKGLELYYDNMRSWYPHTVGNSITWIDESTTEVTDGSTYKLYIQQMSDKSLMLVLQLRSSFMSDGAVTGLCGTYNGCAYDDITETNTTTTGDSAAVPYLQTSFMVYQPSFLWPVESSEVSTPNISSAHLAACSGVPSGFFREACAGDVARAGSSAAVKFSTILYQYSCEIACSGNVSNSLLNESDCASFCSAVTVDLHTRSCVAGKPSPLTTIYQPDEFRAYLQTSFGGAYTVGVKGCLADESVSVVVTCPNEFTVTATASKSIVNSSAFTDEVTFPSIDLVGAVVMKNFASNAASFRFSWIVVGNSRGVDLGTDMIASPSSLKTTFTPASHGDYILEFAAYDGCMVARAQVSVRAQCSCPKLDLTITSSLTSPGDRWTGSLYAETLYTTIFPEFSLRTDRKAVWSLIMVTGSSEAVSVSGPVVDSSDVSTYAVLGAVPTAPSTPSTENVTASVNSTISYTSDTPTLSNDEQRRILASRISEIDNTTEHWTYVDYVPAAAAAPVLCTITITPVSSFSATVTGTPLDGDPSNCFGVFFIHASYEDQECVDSASIPNATVASAGSVPQLPTGDYVQDVYPVEFACGARPRAIACCPTIVSFVSGSIQKPTLSAYDSYDPDTSYSGLTYSWNLLSKPTGAPSMTKVYGRELSSYQPDRKGVYTFGLTVSDSCTSDTANQTVTVLCRELAATASAVNSTLIVNDSSTFPVTTTLSYALDSSKQGEGTITWSGWTVVSYPSALDNWPTISKSVISGNTFTAPVIAGSWVFRGTLSDKCSQAVNVTVTVSVVTKCNDISVVLHNSTGGVITAGSTITINQDNDTGSFDNIFLNATASVDGNSSEVLSSSQYIWFQKLSSESSWTWIGTGKVLSGSWYPGSWAFKVQIIGKCAKVERIVYVNLVCFSLTGSITVVPNTTWAFNGYSGVVANLSVQLSSSVCSYSLIWTPPANETYKGGQPVTGTTLSPSLNMPGTYTVKLYGECGSCDAVLLATKTVTVTCGVVDFLSDMTVTPTMTSTTYDDGKWDTIALQVTLPDQSQLATSLDPYTIVTQIWRFIVSLDWTVTSAPSGSLYYGYNSVNASSWSDTIVSQQVTLNDWVFTLRKHTMQRSIKKTSSWAHLEHLYRSSPITVSNRAYVHHTDLIYGSCITPDLPGTYQIKLSGEDTCGRTTTKTVSISAVCNSAPGVTLKAQTVEHGRVIVQALATDEDDDKLTYTWTGPGVDYWLSEDDKLHSLQPIPGNYSYHVTVSDGCSSTSASLVVNVSSKAVPTLVVDETVAYSASAFEQLSDVQMPLRAAPCSCSVPTVTLDPLSWYEVTCDASAAFDAGVEESASSYISCDDCEGAKGTTKYTCSVSGNTFCLCNADAELCVPPDFDSGASMTLVSCLLLLIAQALLG